MPTTLSLEELQNLADVHTRYEFSHEIDPLMETVHPNPCWIYEPMGCEITTVAAVAEMYTRMFPVIGAMKQPNLVNTWFASDGFIGEVEITKPTPDGSDATSSQFTWCEFTDTLISGEASYLDADDAKHVAKILGESFFSLPGVNTASLI
ncbi:MAG TPA: hypothetical protein VF503_12975 [Sphingobium sp.]|uniref:hypothetical protein n=1 Tax=Sphingobium sp. TaxID=1912891 RepID=UPI002ED2CD5F